MWLTGHEDLVVELRLLQRLCVDENREVRGGRISMGMMMSCYKTPLGLRDQLGTHVEVAMDSGEPNSKVRTEQLSGLAISDQGMVE